MTHLEGNPKHTSSLKTSQPSERSYPHASDVAYASATGPNPQAFGHPMQDLGSGAMATNAYHIVDHQLWLAHLPYIASIRTQIPMQPFLAEPNTLMTRPVSSVLHRRFIH